MRPRDLGVTCVGRAAACAGAAAAGAAAAAHPAERVSALVVCSFRAFKPRWTGGHMAGCTIMVHPASSAAPNTLHAPHPPGAPSTDDAGRLVSDAPAARLAAHPRSHLRSRRVVRTAPGVRRPGRPVPHRRGAPHLRGPAGGQAARHGRRRRRRRCAGWRRAGVRGGAG
jgi:hypothetical protein